MDYVIQFGQVSKASALDLLLPAVLLHVLSRTCADCRAAARASCWSVVSHIERTIRSRATQSRALAPHFSLMSRCCALVHCLCTCWSSRCLSAAAVDTETLQCAAHRYNLDEGET